MSHGQTLAKNVPPRVNVTLKASSNRIDGVLTLAFAKGLHGYQNPFPDKWTQPVSLKVLSGGKLVKARYPKGKLMKLTQDTAAVPVYEGTVKVPFTAIPAGRSGAMIFQVDYQQCTSTNDCFRPSKLTLSVHYGK